jgi:RNA polymerase sigma-70 factor (ECF subfamily)
MRPAAHKLRPNDQPQAAESRTFDDMYVQHFGFVWRNLRRLGVHEASVEDAAQDTFVVVHRRLQDLRPDASVKAWLFAIALRVAHDHRRTQRRKATVHLDTDAHASPGLGPFEQTACMEAAGELERFLSSLDDRRRAVFVMAELEDMTAPEITESLGVGLNTVYSRLRSARMSFVAFLESSGERHE